MKYSYEIKPRPPELGGGWKLALFDSGEEVGGGVFPVEAEEPHQGVEWWSALPKEEQVYWLTKGLPGVSMSSSKVSIGDARHAYLLNEAYLDALDEAEAWLGSRA